MQLFAHILEKKNNHKRKGRKVVCTCLVTEDGHIFPNGEETQTCVQTVAVSRMIQQERGALSAQRFNSADAVKENTNVPGSWKHFCVGTKCSVSAGPDFP